MKLNTTSLAKAYLLSFGLINFNHVLSLIGINESIASAPSYLTFSVWHGLFFLVYGVLPIVSVFVNDEKAFLMVAGVALLGVLTEALGVFTWISVFHVAYTLLSFVAAAVATMLAANKVALKVAAEILNLERSQF
jgi:hypothetical protein